jgi:Protein of unknown function (DUF1559)
VIGRSRPGRQAFTLAQTIFGLVAAVLASGIVLIAIEHTREQANRLTCANNLRELALAVHRFHTSNGTMPPYWGAYPGEETLSIKGSWFCHLLPYVGETEYYGLITSDIQRTGVNWDFSPGQIDLTRRLSTPAPRTEDVTNLALEEVARYNGHRHWERADAIVEPAALADGRGTEDAPGGVFRPEFCARVFPSLRCPSDPSPGSYADAGHGQVYLTRPRVWGSTNYLANWNAFAGNDRMNGYLSPAQSFGTITDGLANTVLFSEGYSWCDGKGRLALNSWDYHSFGLTWSLPNAIIDDDGSGPKKVDFPYGMPNTYMFQVRPVAKEAPDCTDGENCCDNWRAQGGHSVLNAAMADGSLREFSSGMSPRVWDHALLPRDGLIPGWEW